MSAKTVEEAREKNFSPQFTKEMEDRVLVGFFKYGDAGVAGKAVDFVECIAQRVSKYKEDGNTEWLVDAANFAMLEFMYPKHPDAHFRATSAAESPGVRRREGLQWYGPAGKPRETE